MREGQHLEMVSEGELLIQVSVIPRSTEESLSERTLTVKLFAILVKSGKDVSSNFPHRVSHQPIPTPMRLGSSPRRSAGAARTELQRRAIEAKIVSCILSEGSYGDEN